MYRADERIQPLGELSALSFEDQDIAGQLRDLFSHYRAQEPDFTAAYDRLVHEIGFTSLNRLVALRLAEERGYVVECVRKALDSEGFRIYQLIVDDQLGSPFETYRFFLHLIFDEMAVDLHFLFDRSLPQGLIFPSEPVLRKVLGDLSADDLVPLWKEDETIGWVYQFFNDPEERKRMREQSQAPRNSREMAVRNQFFTPRYVVEFLVDNTLGRTWIEMRQGKTGLKDRCQYLLKRTDEVFLSPQGFGGGDHVEKTIDELLDEPFDLPAEGDDLSWKHNFDRAWGLAHQVEGYRSSQWTDRENTPAHYARLEPGADPFCADDLTTQEILEAMYLRLRGDRMCDGPGSPDPARNLRLYEAANEVRRRYQESVKPDATKEELLAAPFFVQFRAEKDPRDLKILDPACGSGHFLLYSFDLLEAIYREAWNNPTEPAPKFLPTGKSLREDYESLEDLEKALPGLILANNLFGVDIDPRAAQIAAIALWLRAQRAYQEAGLRNMADRPQITKMNFVVAEPMPGEADLKREFFDSLRPRVVAQVAEKVFEVMKLAGEAGVLLRVEQALSDTLTAARKQWEAEREVPEGLFPELARASTKSLFDVSDIDDDAFWEIAEETILEALSNFAEKAEASDPLRRRLFADDSARGFAFIDLCRTRFDAFLMNPPFGEPTSLTKPMLEFEYQDAKSDVLQAFVERGSEMLAPAGYLGCISSRMPFLLGGSQDFRERVVLRLFRPSIFADFGVGVMDAAMVEAAAYCLRTLSDAERKLLVDTLAIDADATAQERSGAFRRSHWESLRGLKRPQAEQELSWLVDAGFLQGEERETKSSSIRAWRRTSKAIPLRAKPFEYANPIPFIRTIEEEDKNGALQVGLIGGVGLFFADVPSLRKVPGVPFAYWASDSVRELFQKHPPFESNERTAKQGLATADDFRFLRLWWEVPPSKVCPPNSHPTEWQGPYCVLPPIKWFPFATGGEYSPFYSDVHLVINWASHGAELKQSIVDRYVYLNGNAEFVVKNSDYYFRPGLTWPIKNRFTFKPWPLPRGSIFAHVGPSGFILSNDESDLLTLQGILSSSIFNALAKMMAGWNFEVGVVMRTPIPRLDQIARDKMSDLVLNLVSEARGRFLADERYRICYPLSSRQFGQSEANFQYECLRKLENVACDAYGIMAEHAVSVSDATNISPSNELDPELTSDSNEERSAGFSVLVGVVFGRWDLRQVPDARRSVRIVDPFEALPVCPPGMLQGTDGMPALEPPSEYPIEIPWDGILVDDPGEGPGGENNADVIARLRRGLTAMYGDQSGSIEREICSVLGIESLRDYLRKPAGFFGDHLRHYSKSRRKAPIYWPLGTINNSYTLWIYYPRLTEQTIYTAVERYVRPKLATIERQRDALESQLREASLAPAKDRDRLAQLRMFAQELAELRDGLLRVAALPYKPDLDDGVVINAAPLRKLFGHKPWVKELDDVWKKLERGDYDWSRMAFYLWPDRVRAKCVNDRSLAIAHDLESICTAPDSSKSKGEKSKGKKQEAALIEEEQS
jgi:SAM-dependent methyltransferase